MIVRGLRRCIFALLICWGWNANIAPAAAGSHTVALSPGWNLLGNSADTALDVALVFGDSSKYQAVWTYAAATGSWSFYTPTQPDGGQAYAASRGVGFLTTINPGEGFWVVAQSADSIGLPDGNPASIAPGTLSPGWNLRASGGPIAPAQLAAAMGSALRSIWYFDNTQNAWRYYSPALDAQGGTALADFIAGKGYLPLESGSLGVDSGFWIGGADTGDAPPPNPVLPSLLAITGSSIVNPLSSVPFAAARTLAGGAKIPVTASWSLTGTGATIDAATGMLTTGQVTSDQTVVIRASYENAGRSYVGSMTVTILKSPRTLTGLSISGPNTVGYDNPGSYALTATFADGSTATVPGSITADGGRELVGNTLSMDQVWGYSRVVNLAATYTENGVSMTASLAVTLIPKYLMGLTGVRLEGPRSVMQGGTATYSLTGYFDSGAFSGPITGATLSLSPTPYASVSGMTLTANQVSSDQVVSVYVSIYDERNGVTSTDGMSVTITAAKQLTGLAIDGPWSVASGSTVAYTVQMIFNDASTSTVSATITLDATPYATISGGTLVADSGGAGQSVHLRATYSVGGTSMTADKTVAITLAGGPDSPVPLNLVSGWNLLGKSAAGTLDVASIFGNSAQVKAVWKWNPARTSWAFFTPTLPDGGAAYAADHGYDPLSSIDGGEGFWVEASSAFSTRLPPGIALSSTSLQSIPSGWNLIAIGDNKTPSQFNQLSGLAPPSPGVIPVNVITLWAWNTLQANWYFYAPELDARGDSALTDYIAGKGYLDFGVKALDPAMGFWVNKP